MEVVLNDDLNDSKPDSKDENTETSETDSHPTISAKLMINLSRSTSSTLQMMLMKNANYYSSIQADEDFSISMQSLVNTQKQLESCFKKSILTPNIY